MKIAVKKFMLTSASCALLAGFAFSSQAETTVLDLANQATAEKVAATAALQPAVSPAAASPVLPVINAPSVAPAAVAVPAPPVEAAPDAASVVALDNAERTTNDKEVPQQVTSVVEKLRGAKVDLSLEDMNQARAALARLDLLLELEQKMHDLQQARIKHDNAMAGGDGSDISAYLPAQVAGSMARRRAGAASPVPVQVAAAMPVAQPERPVRQALPAAQFEVKRINGVNGNYSAVLQGLVDQKVTTVRIGDTLSDGMDVVGITPTTVRLREPDGGRFQTLKIDNVSAMSGGRGAH